MVQDDPLEVAIEMFRQSSSEGKDVSSAVDDVGSQSNEEILHVLPSLKVLTGWKTSNVSSQLDIGVTLCIMNSNLRTKCRSNSSGKYQCWT